MSDINDRAPVFRTELYEAYINENSLRLGIGAIVVTRAVKVYVKELQTVWSSVYI